MKALDLEQLVPGVALAWDIVDDGGRILLPKGTPIVDEQQAKALYTRGWIKEPEAVVPADVPSSVTRTLNSWRRRPTDTGVGRPRFFHVVERLTQLLEEVVADILNGRSRGVPERLIQLAVQIQLQAARDPDGFLASLELFDGGRYGSIHALHSAAFCELVAQGHVRDNALRAKLVAAALTRDIGFLELQDELDQQSEPLTSEQQLEVREHPLSSMRLLRDAGVDDAAWLDAVGQHHERLNGGGYPASLVGDRIGGWARILGIVDIYSALTKTRAYRPAIQGPHAVRALLESRGSSVDPVLAQELIRILGLWPPGLLVRLVSGETAVVVRRTANLKAPEIRVIADSDGRQLLIYQFRDASEPDSLIQEVLPRSSTFRERINHRQLWGDIVFVTRR